MTLYLIIFYGILTITFVSITTITTTITSDRALNKRPDKGVIEMMEGSADAVTNALNDILSMSKTEDGAMRLELRVISVRTLVEAAVKVRVYSFIHSFIHLYPRKDVYHIEI